ncbi:MAG: S-methyl-5'-thioadenosine phosphorylase [Nanoarchaeota archaeon]|nr:S-methyl-5'-thioadenosine phosphorylase [Nanoarchaeota archaeon]MBU1005488.1 S-methyl-5'-thioadenosine phosphorylase [Nanoarchaeota archaeon]MBU1946832.1 S-methyl-5'-thioadenosine phosphorylase [Nanoarchaeota archaeon]
MKIGIIGGSGLEDPKILKDAKEINVDTKFGKPSSPLTVGKIDGIDVVILSRHGRKHNIHPGKVNYRANIWALKEQGVTHIIASSACGSLREEIKPGDFVVIDQFIDRTHGRQSTFYDEDNVAHIPMAEPFCNDLRNALFETAKELKFKVHEKGTVVTIQGPRFSSRAESHMFRSWKADVINMSTVPECVLAREAGICYAVVCMSTDYDCWHESEESVDIQMVLKTFKQNAEKVVRLFIKAIPKIKDNPECYCRTDIKGAVIS